MCHAHTAAGDEPKVSALVKRGLTAERYAVDITADGLEGLEYAEAYPYDLIMLDLMLPRLDGRGGAAAHPRARTPLCPCWC